MRVGLHALGIGTGARPEIIRAVAVAAEDAGFARLWAGEDVVLGVPFAGRRTAEYVAAMRTLWADDPASFHGEFTWFDAVRVNSKPVRPGIPIVVGGNSDPALQRAAAFGDGWYGFNVPAEAVAGRLEALAGYCRPQGRDLSDLSVAVAVSDAHPGLLTGLAAAGVNEFVLVAAPPEDPAAATAWVAGLACG